MFWCAPIKRQYLSSMEIANNSIPTLHCFDDEIYLYFHPKHKWDTRSEGKVKSALPTGLSWLMKSDPA
jgi:hypothetical protein